MMAFSWSLEFPKGETRDESLFGSWTMTIVSDILGANPSPAEAFKLAGPVFKNKVATKDDYWQIPLGYGFNYIEDFSTIDPSQGPLSYGVQNLEVTLFETGLAYGDDAVRFNLTMSLPESLLVKGEQLLQYIQLLDLYNPTEPGIGMSCRVTIDNATDVTIESYEGPGSLLHADSADLTVSKQRTVDKQSGGEENFEFSIFGRDKKDYSTVKEYGAMKTVYCMADLVLQKGSDDMAKVYRQWLITTGARIYKTKSATTFISLPEFETAFSLEEGAPDEEYFDPELLEAFDIVFDDYEEEDFDFDYDVKEIIKKPIKEEKATKEMSGGTYTGTANMSMKALFNNIPKIDLDDQIEFIFEADIPKEALAPGKIIVQYA